MRVQRDIRDPAASSRVDDGERSVCVTYPDLVGGALDPDVVGIIPKLDLSHGREIRPVKQPHGSVPCIRHDDRIGRGLVADALRLLQARQGLQDSAARQIDDADGVVAEFRHVEPLAFQIDGQVIYSAVHVAQRDFRFHFERRRGERRGAGGSGESGESGEDGQ